MHSLLHLRRLRHLLHIRGKGLDRKGRDRKGGLHSVRMPQHMMLTVMTVMTMGMAHVGTVPGMTMAPRGPKLRGRGGRRRGRRGRLRQQERE